MISNEDVYGYLDYLISEIRYWEFSLLKYSQQYLDKQINLIMYTEHEKICEARIEQTQKAIGACVIRLNLNNDEEAMKRYNYVFDER